eukprot:5639542-Pleurochrysis_carterae.AAC.1
MTEQFDPRARPRATYILSLRAPVICNSTLTFTTAVLDFHHMRTRGSLALRSPSSWILARDGCC